jgi:hypothetical protein
VSRHECDCGAVYGHPALVIACADRNHGQRVAGGPAASVAEPVAWIHPSSLAAINDGSVVSVSSDLRRHDDVPLYASPPEGAGEVLADARRYRWLRDLKCDHFTVGHNDGPAANYMTAREWIERGAAEWFDGCPPEMLEAMARDNSIWEVQIYPNTPVGFNVYWGNTLDAAIDAALSDSATEEKR